MSNEGDSIYSLPKSVRHTSWVGTQGSSGRILPGPKKASRALSLNEKNRKNSSNSEAENTTGIHSPRGTPRGVTFETPFSLHALPRSPATAIVSMESSSDTQEKSVFSDRSIFSRKFRSKSKSNSAVYYEMDGMTNLQYALKTLEYTIVYELKRNSHGVVYRCKHANTGVPAVCKAGPKSAIEHEWSILSTLESTVVRCPKGLGFVELGSTEAAMVVSDEGSETLATLVGNTGPLDVAEFIVVACQLIHSLGHVHECNILHRDMKPDNVAVNVEYFDNGDGMQLRPGLRRMSISILDFGIASLLAESAQSRSTNVGTPLYMSPECTGRLDTPISIKSDIYSLGITFFFLLTGTTPFQDSANQESVIYGHLATVPPNVCTLNTAVPPLIGNIIAKMISKNPDDRFLSMCALFRAFLGPAGKVSQSLFPEFLKGIANGSDISEVSLRNDLFNMGPISEIAMDGGVNGEFAPTQTFLGRDDTISEIDEFLRQPAVAARVVCLEGDEGCGKTVVLNKYCERSFSRDFVVSVSCEKEAKTHHSMLIDAIAVSMKKLGMVQLMTLREDLSLLRLTRVWREFPDYRDVFFEGCLEPVDSKMRETSALDDMHSFESDLDDEMKKLLEYLANGLRGSRLVIVVDDAHQMSDLLAAQLSNLMEKNVNCLVFLSIQSKCSEVNPHIERVVEMASGQSLKKIKMHPLDIGDIEKYISTCFHENIQLVRQLAERVHKTCTGNPLGMEKVVRALFFSGVIRFSFDKGAFIWKGYDDLMLDMNQKLTNLRDSDLEFLIALHWVGGSSTVWILALVMGMCYEDVSQLVGSMNENRILSLSSSARFNDTVVEFSKKSARDEIERRSVSFRGQRVTRVSVMRTLFAICQKDFDPATPIEAPNVFDEDIVEGEMFLKYGGTVCELANDSLDYFVRLVHDAKSRELGVNDIDFKGKLELILGELKVYTRLNMHFFRQFKSSDNVRARQHAYCSFFFLFQVSVVDAVLNRKDRNHYLQGIESRIFEVVANGERKNWMSHMEKHALTFFSNCNIASDSENLELLVLKALLEVEVDHHDSELYMDYFSMVMVHCTKYSDIAWAYGEKTRRLLHQNAPRQAIDCIIDCLNEVFGMPATISPSPDDVEKIVSRTKNLLCETTDFSTLTSKWSLNIAWEEETICGLLMHLISLAYFVGNRGLYTWAATTITSRAMVYGVNPRTAEGLAVFGFVMAAYYNELKLGGELAKHALLQMSDSQDAKGISTARVNVHVGMTCQWVMDPKDISSYFNEGRLIAMSLSDHSYALFAAIQECWSLTQGGSPIPIVASKLRGYIELSRRRKLTLYNRSLTAVYGALSLLESGQVSSWLSDEEAQISPDHPFFFVSISHIYYALAYTLLQQYEEAYQILTKIPESSLYLSTGLIPYIEYVCIAPLILIERIRFLNLQEQNDGVLDEIDRHNKKIEHLMEKLKVFAAHQPRLYRSRLLVVQAHLLILKNSWHNAIPILDSAISNARVNSQPSIVVLASGLLFEALNKSSLESIASAVVHTFVEYGCMWGSMAVVSVLAGENASHIMKSAGSGSSTSSPEGYTEGDTTVATGTVDTTKGGKAASFDSQAVAQASKLISSEIDFDKLLVSLVDVVSKFSGAQTVVFALANTNTMGVEGVQTATRRDVLAAPSKLFVNICTNGRGEMFKPDVSLQEFRDIDMKVVEMVLKKTEPVYGAGLSSRTRDGSVACIPLTMQKRLHGIIYVENVVLKNAFTKTHVHMLDMLSSQMTVVLNNARLYSELREHSKALEERNKELISVNESYVRFVPSEFCRLLGSSNAIDVCLGDMNELEMTVFYLDIRDFTSISEQLADSRSVFDLLNDVMSRLGPIIRRHSGFIDKYIGDCIMALFPSSATHATDAVKAACAIIDELSAFNRQRAQMNEPPILVGIGINSGPVVLGTIGETLRMDSTVISDVVNTASRLEGQSKVFGAEILITGDTLNRIDSTVLQALRHRHIGLVTVKGKTIPVDIYEIIINHSSKIEYQHEFEKAVMFTVQQIRGDAFCLLEKLKASNPNDKAISWYIEDCKIKLSMQQTAKYCRANVRVRSNYNTHASECNPYLYHNAGTWEFDVFELAKKSRGAPLYFASWYTINTRDLVETLALPLERLQNFLVVINDGYIARNFYHNSTHGADVVQAVHFIMAAFKLEQIFTPLEQLALIIAATIHDFRHPAVTNVFLKATNSELLHLAEERGEPDSVLECYHLCEAFHVMQDEHCAFLTHLSEKDQARMKDLITQVVLSTDLSKHNSVLNAVKEAQSRGISAVDIDRVLLMKIIIKVADVSNPARPLKIYLRWVLRVIREFWTQGDVEKAYGMPVSPFMDREKPAVAECQVGFMSFIGLPQVEVLCSLLHSRNPDAANTLLSNTKENLAFFQELKERKGSITVEDVVLS